MAEPLKNALTDDLLEQVALEVSQHASEFDRDQFLKEVLNSEWQELELKQRYRHISRAFRLSLPVDFSQSSAILAKTSQAFSGFEYLFFPDFVEAFGTQNSNDYDAAIDAIQIMTTGSSAEFAIRPLLEQAPEKTLSILLNWTTSNNEHLRRLASEGCRPRLPWARPLIQFKKDPDPIFPILEALKQDESLYVRKSVANNLNDISKDHPEKILALTESWLGDHPHTDWIVKHGCRSLLKQGNTRAMALFGYHASEAIKVVDLQCTNSLAIGDTLTFSFKLQNERGHLGKIRIEFAIDFIKANGMTSSKVFKIAEADISSATKQIQKHFSFEPRTTRKYYPGTHQLAIILNGEVKATQAFELLRLNDE